jgi:hypothetical protein
MIGLGDFLFSISKFGSQITQKTLKFLPKNKIPGTYQPHLKIHCKRTRGGGGGKQMDLNKRAKKTNKPSHEIPKNLSGENVKYHPRVGAKIPKIRDLQLTKSHILGMPLCPKS